MEKASNAHILSDFDQTSNEWEGEGEVEERRERREEREKEKRVDKRRKGCE